MITDQHHKKNRALTLLHCKTGIDTWFSHAVNFKAKLKQNSQHFPHKSNGWDTSLYVLTIILMAIHSYFTDEEIKAHSRDGA